MKPKYPLNFKNLNPYAEEKERERISVTKERKEDVTIYRGLECTTTVRRDIPAPRFHEWRGPRKKQAVGQLVPVDSDNCVARAGIRGQNESTLAC